MPSVDLDNSSTPEVFTLGADSAIAVAYDTDGNPVCIKEVRNALGLLLDRNPSRSSALKRRLRRDRKRNRERLPVPYKKRAERLESEFSIGLRLYREGAPVVQVHELREVKWPWNQAGITVGYDLIMEYVKGHDLRDREFVRALSFEQKLDLFHQTAIALRYMHQQGFVHLDVKPSNIMVEDGRVKLIDFGVSAARNTQMDSIRGTRGYMAPEQIVRGMVDERTDVFGLGVTFNVVFGGHPLKQNLHGVSQSERARMAGTDLHHDRPLIDVAKTLRDLPALENLIKGCTIPQRAKRMGGTLAVIRQLREIAAAEAVTLTPVEEF